MDGHRARPGWLAPGLLFLLLASAGPAAGQFIFIGDYRFEGELGLRVPVGGNVTFATSMHRTCPGNAVLLPTESVHLTFMVAGNLTVTGDGRFVFPEQVCATQPTQSINRSYQLQAKDTATPGPHSLAVQIEVQPRLDRVPPSDRDRWLATVVVTPAEDRDAPAAPQSAPGLGVASCLALALVSASLRRSR